MKKYSFYSLIFIELILLYLCFKSNLTRLDLFSLGNSNIDGLALLGLYFIFAPLLALVGVVKFFVSKDKLFLVNIFLAVLITLPALCTNQSQIGLLIGTIVTSLSFITISLINFRFFKSHKTSKAFQYWNKANE